VRERKVRAAVDVLSSLLEKWAQLVGSALRGRLAALQSRHDFTESSSDSSRTAALATSHMKWPLMGTGASRTNNGASVTDGLPFARMTCSAACREFCMLLARCSDHAKALEQVCKLLSLSLHLSVCLSVLLPAQYNSHSHSLCSGVRSCSVWVCKI
jgi:hypothetical protein